MSDSGLHRWDQFWFLPADSKKIAWIRFFLCMISVAYFVSCWPDIDQWYGIDAVLSAESVANAIHVAGAEQAGKWVVSPLFLTNNVLLYRLYLLLGIGVCITVLLGRGGRLAGFMLFAIVVGWANRSMFLAGLAETLLCQALFAVAIAQPTTVTSLYRRRSSVDNPLDVDLRSHWTNRVAVRLLSLQTTLIGGATFATMLAGRVWWNGLGAYALAAPVQDRTIDWSESLLANTIIHEGLTFLLIAALPIGLTLGWLRDRAIIAVCLLAAWCAIVALLSSHWLYAMTLASMSLAFLETKPRLSG